MKAEPFYFFCLGLLIVNIGAMLDSGEYNDISVDDIRRRAKDGHLDDFLIARAGPEFLGGLLRNHPDFAAWYLAKLRQVAEKDRGACKLERFGLDLLISYTAEIMNNTVDMSVS
jgi:hypothetical protein